MLANMQIVVLRTTMDGLARLLFLSGLLALYASVLPSQTSSSLESLYRQAKAALESQDYARAAEAWKAIVASQPHLAEAHSNLGMMYHLQNRWEEAIPAFQAALKLKPTLLSARLFLGIDYCLTSQPQRALQELGRVLQQDPRNAVAAEWLGMSYLQTGKYFQAAEQLAKAKNLGGSEEAPFHMGRAYQRLSQAEYLLVFRLAPGSPWEALIKADQYALQNKPKLALEHLGHAIQTAPNLAGLRLRRARILEKQRLLTEALEDYLAEVEKHPPSLEAARALLQFVWRNGGQQEAELLEAMLRTRFGDRLFSGTRAPVTGLPGSNSLGETGKEKIRALVARIQPLKVEARTWQERVLRLLAQGLPNEARQILKEPQPPKSKVDKLYWEGRILLSSEDWREALQRLVPLSTLAPDCAEVHYYIGLAAERLAFKALESFTEQFPDSYRVHQLQAEYFLSANERAKAVEAYQKALAINPRAVQLHLALGDIFLQDSEYEKAAAEYENELRNDNYSLAALEKLAHVRLLLRQTEQAKSHLTRYLNLRPDAAVAHRLLGKAYFLESNFEACVVHLEKALKLETTDDETIYFQLSRALQRMGREAEARSHLEAYQRLIAEKNAAARSRLEQATGPSASGKP